VARGTNAQIYVQVYVQGLTLGGDGDGTGGRMRGHGVARCGGNGRSPAEHCVVCCPITLSPGSRAEFNSALACALGIATQCALPLLLGHSLMAENCHAAVPCCLCSVQDYDPHHVASMHLFSNKRPEPLGPGP
jgi:hypothetical protein